MPVSALEMPLMLLMLPLQAPIPDGTACARVHSPTCPRVWKLKCYLLQVETSLAGHIYSKKVYQVFAEICRIAGSALLLLSAPLQNTSYCKSWPVRGSLPMLRRIHFI